MDFSEQKARLAVALRRSPVAPSILFTALAMAFGLAGCNSDDRIPTGEPEIREGRFGISVYEDVALGQGNKAFWRAAITNRYEQPSEGTSPGSIAWIPLASNCAVPRPKAGSRVTFVHTESNFDKTPLFTFNRTDVTARAQRYVARWRAEGRDPGYETDAGGDSFAPANVFVTDKATPHLLVLSSTGKTLWNLVIAEGVQIEAVVLLAPRGGGVTQLPQNTPLVAIGSTGLASCRITPILPVSTQSGTSNRAAEGDNTSRQAIASRRQYFNTFADWFRTSFGASLVENSIGGERVASFLIGPPPASPAARLPFKGLKGAKVQVTAADHFVFGSLQTYRSKSMELITPIATTLAGGDLSKLNKK